MCVFNFVLLWILLIWRGRERGHGSHLLTHYPNVFLSLIGSFDQANVFNGGRKRYSTQNVLSFSLSAHSKVYSIRSDLAWTWLVTWHPTEPSSLEDRFEILQLNHGFDGQDISNLVWCHIRNNIWPPGLSLWGICRETTWAEYAKAGDFRVCVCVCVLLQCKNLLYKGEGSCLFNGRRG